MEQHGIYVGIDVAKAQVDVAIRPGGDRREVSNDGAVQVGHDAPGVGCEFPQQGELFRRLGG